MTNDSDRIFTFIINGSGGHGKDSFIKCIEELMGGSRYVWNYSSVNKVKRLAEMVGWNGEAKTERDRKFLSDLKALTTAYNDMSFKDISDIHDLFITRSCCAKILFLHIREPEEIQRAAAKFNAKTILVKRDSVTHITSNTADANVFNYQYDYLIENNGTINDLRDAAEDFLTKIGIFKTKTKG